MIRTTKGTANSAVSGTTLTVPNVLIEAGHAVVVGVAGITTNPPSSVKYGTMDMKRQVSASNAAAGAAIYVKARVLNTTIADVVVTWPVALTHKAMFVIDVEGAQFKDQIATNVQSTTKTPTTGPTGVLLVPEEFALAMMTSAGPVTDDPGTVGGGFVSGQRDGTTNITIHELYKFTTDTSAQEASKSVPTGRQWINVLVTVTGDTRLQQGITATDIQAAELKFVSLGLDPDNMIFWYNETLDRWEVYDVVDKGTYIANNSDGWV